MIVVPHIRQILWRSTVSSRRCVKFVHMCFLTSRHQQTWRLKHTSSANHIKFSFVNVNGLRVFFHIWRSRRDMCAFVLFVWPRWRRARVGYAVSNLMLTGRPLFCFIVHRDNNEVYRWRRGHTKPALRCAHKGADKAMAPDTWQMRQLLLMPTMWWNDVATLLDFIVENRCVSNQWCSCQVALIPQAKEGTDRPLSICTSMWRLLPWKTHSQLSTWAAGWAGNGSMGAVGDVYDRIHLSVNEQKSCGEGVAVVTQDFETCFELNWHHMCSECHTVFRLAG